MGLCTKAANDNDNSDDEGDDDHENDEDNDENSARKQDSEYATSSLI